MVGTDRQNCKHALHLCRHMFCKVGKLWEGLLSATEQSSSQDSVEFMVTCRTRLASSDALFRVASSVTAEKPRMYVVAGPWAIHPCTHCKHTGKGSAAIQTLCML